MILHEIYAIVIVWLLVLYPIWGTICLIYLCLKLTSNGTFLERGLRAVGVATLATILFTPVGFNGAPFPVFPPWYLVRLITTPNETIAYSQKVSLIIFSVAFAINILVRKKPESL